LVDPSALPQNHILAALPARITVLDRAGVEKQACECYEVVKREFKRLLPPGPAT
jgi:hypothetical protein